jgi:uncharacterized protein (TIGR02145 family)
MKQPKTIIITIASILGAFLVACSDSGTGSGIAQAETVYGLGECEESNEGVIKLVTSENQYYKCVDGDWEETEAPVQSSSSKVFPFAGSGTLKDPRDGQTYRTVKIGDQVWMAENLNYRYLGPTAGEDSSSFCYNDDLANCTKYGRLYTRAAAVGKTEDECGYGNTCGLSGTVRGVCPKGWHLPSWAEWELLFSNVGGENNAGQMLKTQTGWKENGNGTDAFGFSALPAGYREYDWRYYYGEGDEANFWGSDDSGSACYMGLHYGSDGAYVHDADKGGVFSVRCIKD